MLNLFLDVHNIWLPQTILSWYGLSYIKDTGFDMIWLGYEAAEKTRIDKVAVIKKGKEGD